MSENTKAESAPSPDDPFAERSQELTRIIDAEPKAAHLYDSSGFLAEGFEEDLTPKMWAEIREPVRELIQRLLELKKQGGVVDKDNLKDFSITVPLPPESAIPLPREQKDIPRGKAVMRAWLGKHLENLGLRCATELDEAGEETAIKIFPSQPPTIWRNLWFA